jgi:hypothetical protein
VACLSFNSLSIDYFTCLGLFEWVLFEHYILDDKARSNTTSYSLSCTRHKCSCSINGLEPAGLYYSDQIFASTKSSIDINGKLWDLPAPPLEIGLATETDTIFSAQKPPIKPKFDNASDIWRGSVGHIPSSNASTSFQFADSHSEQRVVYWSNGTVVSEDIVKKTGTCISDKAYAWGFSSLILLTFCSYTIAFAIALILLQTDVYWNSRYDRKHQAYSIYTDVLYLAEELKATFGHKVEDHLQSPSKLSKQVGHWKPGLQLKVDGLNMSRWEEWRLLLARDDAIFAADRKKSAKTYRYDESLPDELRSFKMINMNSTGDSSHERASHRSLSRPEASVMAKYDYQRRSEPRLDPMQTSDQSLVSGEYELSLQTSHGSPRASVSEEQGLIVNAALSDR